MEIPRIRVLISSLTRRSIARYTNYTRTEGIRKFNSNENKERKLKTTPTVKNEG